MPPPARYVQNGGLVQPGRLQDAPQRAHLHTRMRHAQHRAGAATAGGALWVWGHKAGRQQGRRTHHVTLLGDDLVANSHLKLDLLQAQRLRGKRRGGGN